MGDFVLRSSVGLWLESVELSCRNAGCADKGGASCGSGNVNSWWRFVRVFGLFCWPREAAIGGDGNPRSKECSEEARLCLEF